MTPRQERQVFGWINGRDPRQYGLDFALRTRRVVADLIEQKVNIRLGLSAVGELLDRYFDPARSGRLEVSIHPTFSQLDDNLAALRRLPLSGR